MSVMSPPNREDWLSAGPLWRGGGILSIVLLILIARKDRVKLNIRPNNAVRAIIQITVYAYWMLYVVTVRERMIDIAAQLLFAYTIETLLHWSRGRTWRISIAPILVVLFRTGPDPVRLP
jgi:hypothetical protein